MSEDHKSRVRAALARFIEKQTAPAPKPTRKNNDPEAQVARECVALMRDLGFDVDIIESKAKFIDGQYRSSGVKYGTCDCIGTDSVGFGVFVEFKAPGKRGTFWRANNERQQNYLINKIDKGAFAVVVDSPIQLKAFYTQWRYEKSFGHDQASRFLMDCLPQRPKRKADTTPLFKDI